MIRRLLRLVADVREGEERAVALLTLNVFVLMTAYYIVKTVREPLILAGDTAALLAGGGAEVKSYLAAAQAMVLVVAVPAYGWLASRFERSQLLWIVTLFFVGCIQVFWVMARVEVPYLGIPYFIWVGIFSLAVIAQFWSFANDVCTTEQGERLFPLVGLGMTAGAAAGSRVADQLFSVGVGAYEMLQVSAALLVLSGGLYALHGRGETGTRPAPPAPLPDGPSGFTLVLTSPYLRGVAALFICLNLVNTTGEFLLADLVQEAAAAAGGDPGAWIGAFYGRFFFWVNVAAIGLQALVVSRMVRVGGVAAVLFALPVLSGLTYALAGAGVGLLVFRWAKTAENATDYSVMNTAKAMLWLPTSREEKYKAKQAIDTFFVRLGDVLAAVVVWVGLHVLGLGRQGFALVNLAVIVVWLGVVLQVWRGYRHASRP